jgi:hypothetical protein
MIALGLWFLKPLNNFRMVRHEPLDNALGTLNSDTLQIRPPGGDYTSRRKYEQIGSAIASGARDWRNLLL